MIKDVYYHFVDDFGFIPSAADIVKYLKCARNYKTTEKVVTSLATRHGLELSTVSSYPRRIAC